MRVDENFAADALKEGEKKLFVFTWHDHIRGEQGESGPQEMTDTEALARFRQMLASDFSPFLTRSFHEVKGERSDVQRH